MVWSGLGLYGRRVTGKDGKLDAMYAARSECMYKICTDIRLEISTQ